MIIMVLYLQVNELLRLFNEYFQVDSASERRRICGYFLFLLDEDRQRWKRIYVEGPATGTLGRSSLSYTKGKLCAMNFS